MSTSRYLACFLLVVLLLTMGVYRTQAVQIEPLSPPEAESLLDCRECHWDVYLRWEQSAHGRGLSCGQCHLADQQDHARQGHGAQGGAQACMGCHTTGYDPVTDTWKEDNVHCTACHSPAPADHPESPMPVDRSEELCGQCHIQARFEWQSSLHGQAGVACVSCHSQHSTSLKSSTVSGQCASCHEEQTEGFSHSVHHDQGLSCANCHLAPLETPLGEGTAKRNHSFHVDIRTCVECHEVGLHAAEPSGDQVPVTWDAAFSDPTDAMASSTTVEVSSEPEVGSPYGFVAVGGTALGMMIGGVIVGMAIVLFPWVNRLFRLTRHQKA